MRKLLLLVFAVNIVGCEHSKPLGNGDGLWVGRGAYWYDDVFYCEVKKDSSGAMPKPICYEAGMVNMGDRVPRK